MAIKHNFVCGIADKIADILKVQPSNWNNEHDIDDNTITASHLVETYAKTTSAGTITVGSDKDYTTLQGALDSIEPVLLGDVLILPDAGTYSEDLRLGGWTSKGAHKITIKPSGETTDLTDAMTGGTAGSLTAQATVVKTGAGYTVDVHKGRWLEFTSGTNNGKLREIESNASDAFTLGGALLPATPSNGDTFKVVSNNVTINSTDIVINPTGVELCFENVNLGDVTINNSPLIRFIRCKRTLSGFNNNKISGSTVWDRNGVFDINGSVYGLWNYGSLITADSCLFIGDGAFSWGILNQAGGHSLIRNGSVLTGFSYTGLWIDVGGSAQVSPTDSYGIEVNTNCFIKNNVTGILALAGGDCSNDGVTYSGNTTDKTPASASDGAWIT